MRLLQSLCSFAMTVCFLSLRESTEKHLFFRTGANFRVNPIYHEIASVTLFFRNDSLFLSLRGSTKKHLFFRTGANFRVNPIYHEIASVTLFFRNDSLFFVVARKY